MSAHLGLSASTSSDFSAFVSRFGSVPGSFFMISSVAWRTSSSSWTCLSRVFVSRSMSCRASTSSGRSSYSLLTGAPFFRGFSSPPLWPKISLLHAYGAVLETPWRSATSAADPALASSSATTRTFFSTGTGSGLVFGPRSFRLPGASSSIQPHSVCLPLG